MTTTLETIARAIYEADFASSGTSLGHACWPADTKRQPTYRALARAAVEAIREPTDAMLRASYEVTAPPNATPAGGLTRWATWEEVCEAEDIRDQKAAAFRAAIDQILSEGERK